MDPLVTFANLLFVGAYFVRSMVWLRVLALSGASCLAVYFYTLPQPLMNVVYWNLFYVAVNSVWIGRLLVGQRTGDPSSPERSAAAEPARTDQRGWGFTGLLAGRSR